jgi:hypothetical protein
MKLEREPHSGEGEYGNRLGIQWNHIALCLSES